MCCEWMNTCFEMMFDSTFWALYHDEHKFNHSCPVGGVFSLHVHAKCLLHSTNACHLLKFASCVNHNRFSLLEDSAADAQINESPCKHEHYYNNCYLVLMPLFFCIPISPFVFLRKKVSAWRRVNIDVIFPFLGDLYF